MPPNEVDKPRDRAYGVKMRLSRKTLSLVAKGLVSALFVALVVRAVDLGDTRHLFTGINWRYCGLLVVLSAMGITTSCIKWRILLRTKGRDVSLLYLVSLYLLGYFFNNFMPSMVGGDVGRGHYLGRKIGSRTDGYLSVFMERLTGSLALLVLVIVVAFVDHPLIRDSHLELPLIVFVVLCLLALAVILSRRLFSRFVRILPSRLRQKVDSLHQSLSEFRRHPVLFGEVLALSFLFHITTGVNVITACNALGATVDSLQVILVTPLIIMASVMPITINGIGLWEGGFVLFLSFAGVPPAVALSAALLLRVKNLLVSALGAVVFFTEDRNTGRELMDEAHSRRNLSEAP